MSDLTKFNGVTQLGRPLQSDIIETSFIYFLQWSLLGIGAFENVYMGASGAYGGQKSKLRGVSDPRLISNQNCQAWESFRMNWVWESGVEYSAQPIRPTGVWVNSTFYPSSTTGVYAHTYDFPRGRVVFNTAIPASSLVQTEYSYRTVNVDSSDKPWFRTVQMDSYRLDNPQFLQQGSGSWNVLAENRIQLPAIVVEVVPQTRHRPREMGTTARTHQQTVVLHVLAETPWDRDQLHDVLVNQYQKSIMGIDKRSMAAANAYPLQYNGAIASGAMTYPQTITTYPWRPISLIDLASNPVNEQPPLYWAAVNIKAEVELPAA
jgi:hypothetical protein